MSETPTQKLTTIYHIGVPETWPEEVLVAMDYAYRNAVDTKRKGHYETLMAVGASAIRSLWPNAYYVRASDYDRLVKKYNDIRAMHLNLLALCCCLLMAVIVLGAMLIEAKGWVS